jgi:hypothetical protein
VKLYKGMYRMGISIENHLDLRWYLPPHASLRPWLFPASYITRFYF